MLDTVARIPAGRVMTYGDVAEYVGAGTARTVGTVLARFGDEDDVPWHRVIRASGEPNPSAPAEALRRLQADGTPLGRSGDRVDLARARWDGEAGEAGAMASASGESAVGRVDAAGDQ
ncbi:cysteine methyltransferase [Parafrankia colletiae]|uniref:Cysteine methyltransferase n=1 Tax=Parafrankia colletiae TaxID=573497 RepID=A0A1S1QAJ5_9ACTN|nr:MGMT family protein [Parafrankia colletiae]OHV30606.1 cysteine methyltransferase [Parafrankia colletiae]